MPGNDGGDMEAGLFYTAAGPWLAAAAFLALVFTAFRHPIGGMLGFVGLSYALPYFTYRNDLQAIATAAMASVLFAAALIRRPPRLHERPAAPDLAMLVFVALMALAAVRGLQAGHARSHLAADVYHYLVVGPLLYVAGRRLLHPDEVSRFLGRLVWLAAAFALPAIAIIAASGGTGDLVWLVGAPLDEGGVRIKPDFAYPLVPMVIACAHLVTAPPGRGAVAAALLATTLVLTYKRTFWASAVAGTVVAAVLASLGGRPAIRRVVIGLGVAAVALAAGISVAALAGLNVESARARGTELTRPAGVATVQSRSDELVEVLRYVRAAPFGYGLGAAPRLPFGDPSGEPRHYTHTIYLQWCIQGGVPAGLAGVALLSIVIGRLVRRRDGPAVALASALSALALAGFALQSLNSPISALTIGLGASLASDPNGGALGRSAAPGQGSSVAFRTDRKAPASSV